MSDDLHAKAIEKVKSIIRVEPTKSCIGCGYCCRKAPCFLGTPGGLWGCYWLNWVGELWMWRCGLLACTELSKEHDAIKQELHIGAGCCSPLNDWRRARTMPTPAWLREHGDRYSLRG